MALARAYSVALVGVRGHLIEVEADIASGLPATILVGLPDTALREARDRIRAAIVNSGQTWPNSKITVGLSPAALPKRGSGFDLAIAVAILAAAEAVPAPALAGKMFLAELGLDGRLRPVPGVLPAVVAAEAGVDTVVVAAQNVAEAALVPGVRVVGASSLMEVIVWLRGGPPPTLPAAPDPRAGPAPALAMAKKLDLAEVLGQAEARLAVEICAAAGTICPCLARRERGRRCWPSGCRRSCQCLRWRRRSRSRRFTRSPGASHRAPGCCPSRRSAPRTTRRRWPRSSAAAAAVPSTRAPRAWRTVESSSLTSQEKCYVSFAKVILSGAERQLKASSQVRRHSGVRAARWLLPYIQSVLSQRFVCSRLSVIGSMLDCVSGFLADTAGSLF